MSALDQRTSERRLARGKSSGDVRVEMGGESDLEARGPVGRDRRGRVTWSPVGGVRRGELAGECRGPVEKAGGGSVSSRPENQ